MHTFLGKRSMRCFLKYRRMFEARFRVETGYADIAFREWYVGFPVNELVHIKADILLSATVDDGEIAVLRGVQKNKSPANTHSASKSKDIRSIIASKPAHMVSSFIS